MGDLHQADWVQISDSTLNSITLGRVLDFSVPQFLISKTYVIITSAYKNGIRIK